LWEALSALAGPFDVSQSASTFVTNASIYDLFAVLVVRFFRYWLNKYYFESWPGRDSIRPSPSPKTMRSKIWKQVGTPAAIYRRDATNFTNPVREIRGVCF
jgi:hypothetical protein